MATHLIQEGGVRTADLVRTHPQATARAKNKRTSLLSFQKAKESSSFFSYEL